MQFFKNSVFAHPLAPLRLIENPLLGGILYQKRPTELIQVTPYNGKKTVWHVELIWYGMWCLDLITTPDAPDVLLAPRNWGLWVDDDIRP